MNEGADDAGTARDDPVEQAREEVIQALERSAEVYGLNQSYGRLYGVLFFENEPLSLDELVEESGYAKSTVSTAMQKLNRLHLVHRRSVPGEGKKAFYEAETDFWHVVQKFLQHEVRREIDVMTRALDSAADRLDGVDDEQAQADLERIESLRTMYDRSERLLDILTSSSIDRLTGLLERLRRD
ncbi:GbsR/MarR family transcriptional regulator [Halobellus rubicundus]|uniref:HTH-type transcriptional regulator n=1 Tax=Halobellus rubicundus TaxID=2996466 RepID=A0ABD5M7L4_9EURY